MSGEGQIGEIRKLLYGALPSDRIGGVLSLVEERQLYAVAEAARELLTENVRYRKQPDAGRMHAHANAERVLRAALDALPTGQREPLTTEEGTS